MQHMEIRVKRWIDEQWSEWLYGLAIVHLADESSLSGAIADQAALHGLLSRLRDLGVPLVSVQCGEPQPLEQASLEPSKDG